MTEFQAMDLNGDGFITADELIRFNEQKAESEKIAAILSGESSGSTRQGPTSGRGSRAKGSNNTASKEPTFTAPGATPPPDRGSEKTSSGKPGSNGPWGNGGNDGTPKKGRTKGKG